MPYRQPKIEVGTTDKMQDITPFAGLLPIVEFWNQLQLPQIIDASILRVGAPRSPAAGGSVRFILDDTAAACGLGYAFSRCRKEGKRLK